MVSVSVACLSDLFHSIIIEEGGAVPCLIMEQSHGAPCGVWSRASGCRYNAQQ